MIAPSHETDVLVVGAGPTGVSAAVMAASLRLRTVIVESSLIGGRLRTIGALENVSGNWSTGRQLADALTADLDRLQRAGRCSMVQAHVTGVAGHDDRAELVLEDGRVLSAQVIVVATGVSPLAPVDAAWVSAPAEFSAPALWHTDPSDLVGRTYVLGGDRPLGTWLRTHPQSGTALNVLCPQSDDYKVAEIAGHRNVRLLPVADVSVSPLGYGNGWNLQVQDRSGGQKSYVATTVLSNLGNKPAALEGLVMGEDGYCPPNQQHPRIRVAGDLRSSQYQRIATAQGSGAEAVLACYYATTLQHA